MAPQQIHVLHQPHPSRITQKVQLTYKLFLLENARNTLEQELRNFTNQAYGEVRGVLNSSFPASVLSDIGKATDVKRQALLKLSSLLKDLSAEPKNCSQSAVNHGVRANRPQPVKGSLMTEILRFGPMLQNSLMASSIAKAAQALGAALSQQQLKLFFNSQPSVVQHDDMLDSISPSVNSATQNTSFFSHLDAEQQVVFEGGSQPDSVCVPLCIPPIQNVNDERPQILLPPIQAVFPEISNPKPLVIWGCNDDDQVQHQKQTSFQLLHFLRAKATNKGALEWTLSKHEANPSDSPRQISPTVRTQSCQFRYVMTDDLINALAPKTLQANVEIQSPVFRVKRVKSSRSLIYTCVIATETELWDFGDIFTEVLGGDSLHSPLEGEDCQNDVTLTENSCLNIHWKTQTLQSTEPEREDSPAGSKMLMANSVNIPEFQIRRFEETEVVVSHIVSPGNFYIQPTDSLKKLHALVTHCMVTRSYAEQNCIPDIGTQVIGWFPQKEQWCRAQVMKICGVSRDNNAGDDAGSESSIKVEVKRLDYGDTSCLSLCNIKELPPEMALLPLQALQVSLANVMPVNGRVWSEQAVGWFKAMVHNRTLYARLYPRGPTVTVELFLEKGKLGAMRRGASLSLRLAQNGHAKHDKLKSVGLLKRSAVQLKSRKQDSDWEKYLISCYTQIKK